MIGGMNILEKTSHRRFLGVRLRNFNGWSIFWCHMAQLVILGLMLLNQSPAAPSSSGSNAYPFLLMVLFFACFLVHLKNRAEMLHQRIAIFAYRCVLCAVLLVINPLSLLILSLVGV